MITAHSADASKTRRREALVLAVFGGLTILIGLLALVLVARLASAALHGVTGGAEGLLVTLPAALWGSIFIALGAVVLAIPLALACAATLTEHPRIHHVAVPALDGLANVPTVIYGVLALDLIAPLLVTWLPGTDMRSALAAMIVIAFLVVPLMTSLFDRVLGGVAPELRHAALALGATPWEVERMIVWPVVRPQLLAAVLLCLARALGETMIVTLVAGSVATVSLDPRRGAETLSSWSIELALGDITSGGPHMAAMAVAAICLFALVAATHFGAETWLRRSTPEPAR
ncbi:MAG: ABC transporter permease subunit [Acidobacteriota bacterium]